MELNKKWGSDMDDFDDIVETDAVETADAGNVTVDNNTVDMAVQAPKSAKISKKDAETLLNRSAQDAMYDVRDQAVFTGEMERLSGNKIATQNAITADTLDNVARTAVVFPVNADGTFQFPEIQAPDELKNPVERERYIRNQKRIQDRLKYVLGEYDKEKTTIDDDVKYIAGSAIRSGINLVSESIGLAPIVGGMAVQAIGKLGGDDNLLTRNGVLAQEWTVRQLDNINDGLTSALINERRATDVGRNLSKLVDTGVQVAAIATTAGAGAEAIAGAVAARGAARGIAKEAVEKVAKRAAHRFAEKTGKGVSAMYAAAQTENYLTRPHEGMTSEEYLQYLKSRTGGEILGDLAFGSLVGISNYYLEKAFGTEAAIQNFFGSATDGFLRLAQRRAIEEGLTEIAQDEVLDVADLMRGALGNKARGISWAEFVDNLVSPQTMETFVVSAIIGGATAGVEYRTARVNLVKEYKQGLRKVFPNASEQQLETASKAFVKSTEDNIIGKVHQSIIADDQLRNQYGTYWGIVNNRINDLINQSVAQGKELNFKDKSPEYQAQFVGSVAQRFVDELYAQAALRGVPVNEVFDVTKIDVENGIMYMYGAEYGRRPISALTGDVTPQQWAEAQREKRIADELQKRQKEQEKQAREALKEAQKRERELAREEQKQAKRENIQGRVLARVEIRNMDENQARGTLAVMRPELPVEIMTKGEIKTFLRSEIDKYMALQNKDQIQPIERQKPARVRQQRIIERSRADRQAVAEKRVRMAKPKSFSESVKLAGISKATIQKLGLEGELKRILGKNYRFFVRKNGFITTLEEFAGAYRTEVDSYWGSVNGFLEMLEQDLQTKDIYTPEQQGEVQRWQERSIRAGKEEESRIADAREQELDDAKARLQDAGINTRVLTEDQILEEGRRLREKELAQLESEMPDIDFEAIPDDWLQSIKEQSDLAAENARLDAENLPYKGETITVDGKERTVYNSNGDRIAQSAEALTNFWRWFGDSKVVDEQGRPRVVYHNTYADFDTFAPSEFGTWGPGIYLTPSKRDWYVEGMKKMPLYAKIENPFITNFVKQGTLDWEQLRKDGYDGIIDATEYQRGRFSNQANEIVAFYPEQIKSTENRGTFSPDTGNIFYQKRLAAWNPLRRSIELFDGANETSILHELSHFWLDNMILYANSPFAKQNTGFMSVWANIKKYLNIDDRQERVSEAQAEKYTSAYMQYIRKNAAPAVDLGFKGVNEYIGDISLDYFENAKHMEEDGTITSDLEPLTPEIVDALQKLTTVDLSQMRDEVLEMQNIEPDVADLSDSYLGKEATPAQMKTSTAKAEQEQHEKQVEQNTRNAERDARPVDLPNQSKEMQEAHESLKTQKETNPKYDLGTKNQEGMARARELIARDRVAAETAVTQDPGGITDGLPNEYIALALAEDAVRQGKSAMPYLESFVNGASAAGANLQVASMLNSDEFAWAKDLYEAARLKEYALALRLRPQIANAVMKRSAIARSLDTKLDEYVEKLYPQLLAAQTYEEQVKLVNEWGNSVAKEIGVPPGTEVWSQAVSGKSTKKTDFGKEVAYQKKKLKEFLKSKLGAALSDAEQLKLRELHRNAIDALRALRANPTDKQTKIDFIKQTRAYQDYLNSLTPANWATAIFASIPRASMLFRISTQVKNTLGTRVEVLLSDLNRRLRYGKGNLISKKDISAEIKDSMDMFLIGGFSPDVQESFFDAPTLAWGEKQYSLAARGGERRGAVFSKNRIKEDAKDISDYAKNTWTKADGYKKAWAATKIGVATVERIAGKSYDTMAYCDAYMKAITAVHETAKAATFYAQQEGKANNWTKEQIKKRADELFADARSYIPKTKIGQAIRKQAVEQAKIETFIKSGTLAQMANNIRNSLNLGKDAGIGTLIAPFVSTPANVMQMGADYALGWWRRFDGWKEVKTRIEENAKAGKPIDQKDMEFLEKGYRGTYGGLFLLTMLALFKGVQGLTGDDDTLDYVPPYDTLTAKEKQYYRAVNGGKYNAVKVGNTWINVEYFGGVSEAITALGTWYHNNSIISATTAVIMRSPVIGDLISQHDDLQRDLQKDKGVIDIAMESIQAQGRKYIPGIAQDINKAREKGALYAFLGGSFGFTQGTTIGFGESEIKNIKDTQKESQAKYSPITWSKPFNELDYDTKKQVNQEFDTEYNALAAKWLKTHKNAKPEVTKKALDGFRKQVSEKLKKKYKLNKKPLNKSKK